MNHAPISHLWFRDRDENPTYINETAVRIRAGFLLAIPLYMGLTLFDVGYGSNWVVPDAAMITDTGETDFEGRIIYTVEALRRTYDYTLQTIVLFYALFEMLSGMFVRTAYLSPTIWIASLISRNQPAVYKPLNPKRMAWTIGITMITICLTFFNPVPVAHFLNDTIGTNLSTEENFLPLWLPIVMMWFCIGFMWAEVTLGFCVGCKLHALLVKIGVFKEECEACNNIDWDAIARRAAERKQAE